MPKRNILKIYVTKLWNFKERRYDLMYIKTKELGWKENQGIQNIGIEDSQGNRIVEQSAENLGELYYGTTRST